MRSVSLLDRQLDDVPLAVIDFETTGLSPKAGCRVIEVAVARAEPGEEPRVVLDTLIDPEGPVYATEIHGIDDDDVRGAPRFREAGHWIAESISGAIVATYNASFDLGFLQAEARHAWRNDGSWQPPYVCLMWLRPLLGIGPRCSLVEACRHYELEAGSHLASEDALAAAKLWRRYVVHARANGVHRFRDLRSRGKHKYLKSFEQVFVESTLADQIRPAPPIPERRNRSQARSNLAQREEDAVRLALEQAVRAQVTSRRRTYWHALVAALQDLTLSPDELDQLAALRAELALAADEIRAIHGRLFGQLLASVTADELIAPNEAAALHQLRRELHTLGWAPGDA